MKPPLCTSQQGYLKEKQYIFNYNIVTNMSFSNDASFEFNNNSQLNNDKGHFITNKKTPQKYIQPELAIATFSLLQNNLVIQYQELFFETFKSTIENYTKQKFIFDLAEEISKHMDDDLKLKIEENQYLSKVLICSFIEIKNYFKKIGKRHDVKMFVWYDVEEPKWKENIISVKVDYKDNKEKREIWEKISSIVEKYEEKDIVVLTEIKRL